MTTHPRRIALSSVAAFSAAALLVPAAAVIPVAAVVAPVSVATGQPLAANGSGTIIPKPRTRGLSVPGEDSLSVRITHKKKGAPYEVTTVGVDPELKVSWKGANKSWGNSYLSTAGTWTQVIPKSAKTVKNTSETFPVIKFRLKNKKQTLTKTVAENPGLYNDGDPANFRLFGSDELPERWDPCTYTLNGDRVISQRHNRTNLTWSYAGDEYATKYITYALSKLAPRTGFTYTRVAGNADITISFTVDDSWSLSGSGGNSYYGKALYGGWIKGEIGTATPESMKQRLLMRVFGHVMGLDSVYDGQEIMNSSMAWKSPAEYRAGDRAGLAQLAKENGCVYRLGDYFPPGQQ